MKWFLFHVVGCVCYHSRCTFTLILKEWTAQEFFPLGNTRIFIIVWIWISILKPFPSQLEFLFCCWIALIIFIYLCQKLLIWMACLHSALVAGTGDILDGCWECHSLHKNILEKLTTIKDRHFCCIIEWNLKDILISKQNKTKQTDTQENLNPNNYIGISALMYFNIIVW